MVDGPLYKEDSMRRDKFEVQKRFSRKLATTLSSLLVSATISSPCLGSDISPSASAALGLMNTGYQTHFSDAWVLATFIVFLTVWNFQIYKMLANW